MVYDLAFYTFLHRKWPFASTVPQFTRILSYLFLSTLLHLPKVVQPYPRNCTAFYRQWPYVFQSTVPQFTESGLFFSKVLYCSLPQVTLPFPRYCNEIYQMLSCLFQGTLFHFNTSSLAYSKLLHFSLLQVTGAQDLSVSAVHLSAEIRTRLSRTFNDGNFIFHKLLSFTQWRNRETSRTSM
jgi:hypothetical protein